MRIDGGGRQVVGQRAENEVCLLAGVAARVRGVDVAGVGLGVCVWVRVRMRQGQRQLGARDVAPSDRVCGLHVVKGELGGLRMLGERRKGRGAAHNHAGVASRQPMLGELGEMGQLRVRAERRPKRRPTGQRASLCSMRGQAWQRRGHSLDVVAMVMVVRWWRLHGGRMTVLSVQCLDLGGTPVHLAEQ